MNINDKENNKNEIENKEICFNGINRNFLKERKIDRRVKYNFYFTLQRRFLFFFFFFVNKDRRDWIYLSWKNAWRMEEHFWTARIFRMVRLAANHSFTWAFSLCWLNGPNDRARVNSSLLLIWQIPLGGSEIAIEQTWKKIHPLTCLRTNSGFNTLPFLYL